MTKSETNKIEIPDIVTDPKNPSKRRFQKGKFLGRVSYSFFLLRISVNIFYFYSLNSLNRN